MFRWSLHFYLHLDCYIHLIFVFASSNTRSADPQLFRLCAAVGGTIQHLQCKQVAIVGILAVRVWDDRDGSVWRMDRMYSDHHSGGPKRQDKQIRVRQKDLQGRSAVIDCTLLLS